MDNPNDTFAADPAGELMTLNERILQAEEVGRKDDLDALLDNDFAIIRASDMRHLRNVWLKERRK